MTENKKRVLIFATTYIPFIGGAEVAIREITKRIPDIDFDIVTVNLDGKQQKQEVIDNTTVYRIGSGKFGKMLFPIRAYFLAAKLHRKHRYEAFWSMMASYAGFAGLFFSYRHPRTPFLLTLQEGDSKDELRAKFQFVWFLFKKIFYRATHIQVISNYLAEFALSVRPGAPVTVIPNGVDVEWFSRDVLAEVSQIKRDFEKKEDDVWLVTTSRLVNKNAVRDIIVALESLPQNVQLLIVGDGPLRGNLESGAKEDGVDSRVMFVGEVSYEKVLPYLKASDIFVRPSLSEGFGNSFVEAMAAGLPVIATPVGGIVDFLEDGKTGLLCQPRDPEDVAQKVKMLLENPALQESLVVNARSMVKEKYDWDLIAQRMQSEVFAGSMGL